MEEEKSVRLEKIGPFEYFISFCEEKKAAADYYVRHEIGGLEIYKIRFADAGGEDTPLGFLLSIEDGDTRELRYLYILSEFRQKGYGTAAVTCLEEQNKGKIFRIRLPESMKFYEAMKCIAVKRGYYKTDVVHLYQCERSGFAAWKTYKEKHGNKLMAYLEECGYTTVSLQDASAETLAEVLHSQESEFGNTMNPVPLLEGRAGELVKDISQIALKEGKIAAYCLVLKGDRESLIFEQIAAGIPYQREGAIFAAFVKSVDAFEASGYQKAAYAVYESNGPAMAMAGRLFKQITKMEKRQYHYQKSC